MNIKELSIQIAKDVQRVVGEDAGYTLIIHKPDGFEIIGNVAMPGGALILKKVKEHWACLPPPRVEH